MKFRRLTVLTCVLGLLFMVASGRDFVVALDAGHGGKDYGAIGNKTNEKSITLAVVKQLGKLIESNLPDVKVVYTRDKDVYLKLDQRADIANKANSDLFISVHVNSVDKRNRRRNSIAGCQVYTLGLHKTAENLAVAKRENAVIELEPDYTERYAAFDMNSSESDIVFELSQNKRLDQSIEFADEVYRELVEVSGRVPKGVRQAGFLVLWATSMPSVLVELDYICNPDCEKYLSSEKGQKEMVTAIYNAFCAYLNTYGAQVTGRTLPVAMPIELKGGRKQKYVPEAVPDTPQEAVDDATPVPGGIPQIADSTGVEKYYVQILASATPLEAGSRELKGMKDVEYYHDGAFYKYAVRVDGGETEAKKALKTIRKTFPQCFVVKMVNGCRVDFIKP